MILAQNARAQGKAVSVIALEGFADQNWDGYAVRRLTVEGFAAARDYLSSQGVDAVTFAGLVRRPDMETFAPDQTESAAGKALRDAARQGDDRLLRSVIAYFEGAGFQVIGVSDIAPGHIVGEGLAGRCMVPEEAREDCQRAADTARRIGAMDIGQSVVAAKGVVLAVEAQEGTAAMLARCAALPQALRGTADRRRGVLAKWAKPGQDRRIDLPVVGTETVNAVAQAGLAGLVLEAGAVILLEPEAVISAADRHGLFILGMKAEA